MPGITHSVVATGVDSGDQVSKNAWNAEHVVPDGALAQAAVAGLVADLAGKAATAHDHAGVYSPVGHGHAAGAITGLGTAALVDTGTGAANVPTITQADARYALAGTATTIGLAVALAAGVVAY